MLTRKIEQLARIMSAYVTARLLQRYDWAINPELPPDEEVPIRFHHTIENRSGSGVWVQLHDPYWDPTAASPELEVGAAFEDSLKRGAEALRQREAERAQRRSGIPRARASD